MKRKISSKSLPNLSQVSTVNFHSLPRLVTSRIFQNLEIEDIIKLRESNSRLQFHVDDHFRRNFIKWKRGLLRDGSLNHNEILLLSIEEFTKMNFVPPYIIALINKTRKIAASAESAWRDFLTPTRIDEKEKLLKLFYAEADKVFDGKEKKIIFTLTLLQIIKSLSDSNIKSVHPFNRKSSLRLEFNVRNIFFAIPFYNFIFDWFSFNSDWINVLLLFTKFLEMKSAIEAYGDAVTWVNFLRPVKFSNASIIFGRKNPLSRAKALARVKCSFCINADREMIEALKRFIETREFDWEKSANEFRIEFRFASVRTRVCKSLIPLKFVEL